jgi:hypothetical protein
MIDPEVEIAVRAKGARHSAADRENKTGTSRAATHRLPAPVKHADRRDWPVRG